MGEPIKRQENVLANIAKISAFEKQYFARVNSDLEKEKKRIEKTLQIAAEKKEAILRDLAEREAREAEKARIFAEREQAVKEAASAPILPKKPSETGKTEEPKIVEIPAEVEEAPVIIDKTEDKDVEKPVSESVLPIQEELTPEAREEALRRERDERLHKQKSAIIAPLFETKPKPAIEKPVIRIYIPPVTEQRNQKRPARDGGVQSDRMPPRPQIRPMRPGDRPAPVMPQIPPQQRKDVKKKSDKPYNPAGDDRQLSKKAKAKKGFESVNAAIEYDELSGEIKKIRTRKTGSTGKKAVYIPPVATVIDHAVITDENLTIKTLSEKIGKTGSEIIKKLLLLGIIKRINDTIDFDTADLVASELGVKLELQHTETSEEKLIALHDVEAEDAGNLKPRPPIVTIMGHVDHGKTSILDFIRKANVAGGEAGGITQHIGAYTIVVNGSEITFLDTPGHEAFTSMRARGANVTDIAVIVVAADDGIMPQTIEAINHAKAAGVSIIIAINKMDRPGADPERVLTQLTEHGILSEKWGGEVPAVEVSAKTGMGIPLLLDTILLTADVMELKANPDRAAKGTIVEAKLDKGKGPMATVLVQNGTLNLGDFVVAGSVTGKIRAMQDERGKAVKKATPSTAVSILGLQEVPDAGDQLMVVKDEKLMKQVVQERINRAKELRVGAGNKVNLDDVFSSISEGKLKNLNIILKADVQGSVEAIKDSLVKLSNEEVKVSVVHAVVGAINESDVTLADSTNSIIIGFNVRPDNNARALAEKNGIDIRMYRVIYDAIDDVSSAIKGLLAPKFREQYLGRAEVRATYRIKGAGTVAGCIVKDGKIVRNAKVRLLRNNIVVSETSIASLKRMKDDVKEVLQGFECGIGLDRFDDIKEGDVIESFNIVQEEV